MTSKLKIFHSIVDKKSNQIEEDENKENEFPLFTQEVESETDPDSLIGIYRREQKLSQQRNVLEQRRLDKWDTLYEKFKKK